MKKTFPGKQKFKRISKKCRICGEDDYTLLDVHRIVPGKDGGKYTNWNSVTLCCKCHRLVHGGNIKIKGWHNSTAGKILLIGRDDEEEFI